MSLPEKAIASISFKCTEEFERELQGVAEAFGVRRSEFIRIAVEEKVKRARSMYEALHQVDWQAMNTGDDEV